VSTSTTPAISFNGISQYASDFEAILTKAVQVAQIPVTLLQTEDSTVLSKETALGTINTDVASLGSSLESLGSIASNQALSATSSDPNAVSVTDNGATQAGSYTINSITSSASAASETSTGSFTDSSLTPVSSTGTMELKAGAFDQTFALTNNTLVGLRDQINSMDAGVTASILTTSAGNYLSLAANSTGATTLQLIDDPITTTNPTGANTELLTQTNQGSDAVFQLNGVPVDQPGNVVNSVVPGLTFTIQQASTTPVTLSLATDPTQLSSGLQTFVSDYNTVQADLTAQTGTTGGALAGDTVVNQLRTVLQQIGSQTLSTGTVQSLSDLGITFSSTGVASFNQTTFDSLSSTQISDAFKFIGSTTSGLGGFSQTLTEFSDPISGIIQAEQGGLKQTDTDLQAQITTLNAKNATTQAALTAQLEAADAQQEELQQQQTDLTASLQGLNLVLYGRDLTSQ
jgi:flagellar hook-associated protein 2